MGFMDSVFGGGGGDSKPQLLEPVWQTRLRKRLSKTAEPGAQERLTRAGEAYPGELTAGLSEYEKSGLTRLEDYLNAPAIGQNPLYQLGRTELEKTLTGDEYDPAKNTYYQAYKEAVMRELQEAKDRLAASTSARDRFFGGGRISATGELEEGAVGQLNLALGQLAEQERARRLGAVPQALNIASAEQMEPLARAEAGLRYGGIPRAVEQAGLTANYDEWLRQLNDLGIPLDVALNIATYKPDYYTPAPTPSILSQLAPMLGQFAGSEAGSGALAGLGKGVLSAGGGLLSGLGGAAAGAGGAAMGGLGALAAMI